MAYPPNCEAAMDRRRFLKQLAFALAGVNSPLFLGCSPAPPFVVAIHPWVGYETLYLAKEFKWLPERIVLLEGNTFSDSFAALKSGQADAACVTLDEMLRVRASGIPLTAVLVFDVSAGSDVALARQEITKLTDLAGKRLGLEKNALGELMLHKVLEFAGLPESSLTLIDLPPDQQLAAWQKKEIDALITYEPTATQLIHEGAHRLFDSRRIPDTIFDVLAVRSDRIKDIALLQALVTCHFRALEHMLTYRQDALFRISAREGLKPDEIQLALAGATIPSLAANRGYLIGKDSKLITAADNLSKLMTEHGMLEREDNLEGLVFQGALPGGRALIP